VGFTYLALIVTLVPPVKERVNITNDIHYLMKQKMKYYFRYLGVQLYPGVVATSEEEAKRLSLIVHEDKGVKSTLKLFTVGVTALPSYEVKPLMLRQLQ